MNKMENCYGVPWVKDKKKAIKDFILCFVIGIVGIIVGITANKQSQYAVENYLEQTFVFEKCEYFGNTSRINNAYYLIYVEGEGKPFRLECNVVRMTGRQLIDELEKGDKITCCFADVKKSEYDMLAVKTEKETILSLEEYKSAQNTVDILWIAAGVFIALMGPVVLVVNIVQNKKAEQSDMYKYRINW